MFRFRAIDTVRSEEMALSLEWAKNLTSNVCRFELILSLISFQLLF